MSGSYCRTEFHGVNCWGAPPLVATAVGLFENFRILDGKFEYLRISVDSLNIADALHTRMCFVRAD